jgi:hypothetical protein
LRLLSSFCRLINGGVDVTPHVLKEIWGEGQDQKIAANFSNGEITEDPDLSTNILRLLSVLSPKASRKGIFIETIIAEEDDGSDADLEFSSAVTDITPDEGLDEIVENKRFQNVMLAAAPFHAPEVAVIMVIDGAVIDLGRQSGTRAVIENITGKALKFKRSEGDNSQLEHRLQEQELFERWSKLKNKSDRRQVSIKDQLRKMPSVKNLSIRKALQILQDYNLRIRVVGSGRVRSQHPAPGTLLNKVGDCTLELSLD